MNFPEKYPAEFIQRISARLASEAGQFFAALEQPAPVSIRKHPVKGNNCFDGSEKVPWCTTGVYLAERPVFTLDPLFHAGAYYVQEASSMFLHHVLEQLPVEKTDLKILDLCAAPGGKSTLAASWLAGEGLLVSNEVIQTRIPVLIENTIKWGYANTIVTHNDAAHFARLPEFFDIIITDAPCSGEGLFRKDPDAIQEWSAANCTLCENRQQRILEDVLPALKTGGILIYSTCTYNPGENDDIIRQLCTEHEMQVQHIPVPDEWNIIKTPSGGFAFYPHKIKGEGFFCCVLMKNEPAEHGSSTPRPRKKNQQAKKITSEISDKLSSFLLPGTDVQFIQNQEEWIAVPGKISEPFIEIKNALYVKHAGIPLGTFKGHDFIPSPELPFYLEFTPPLPTCNLSKDDALRFLKKDTFALPETCEKGWVLMMYENHSLGWIKNLGNRWNNYYPNHWKIRMDLNR